MHESVGGYGGQWKTVIYMLVYVMVITIGYVWALVTETAKTTEPGMSDGGKIGMVIVVYIVLLFAGIAGFIVCMVMTQRKKMKEVRNFLDDQNMRIYNPRGIHWSIGARMAYIQVILNFDDVMRGVQVGMAVTPKEPAK